MIAFNGDPELKSKIIAHVTEYVSLSGWEPSETGLPYPVLSVIKYITADDALAVMDAIPVGADLHTVPPSLFRTFISADLRSIAGFDPNRARLADETAALCESLIKGEDAALASWQTNLLIWTVATDLSEKDPTCSESYASNSLGLIAQFCLQTAAMNYLGRHDCKEHHWLADLVREQSEPGSSLADIVGQIMYMTEQALRSKQCDQTAMYITDVDPDGIEFSHYVCELLIRMVAALPGAPTSQPDEKAVIGI